MELQVKHTEFGLSEQKANEITKGLNTIIREREALEEQYLSLIMEEITPELSEEARELRLRIRDNRTKGLTKWHKANKEYFLQGGKFVDAIKNKNIIHNEEMENKLLAIEKYEENLEKERKKKLAESRLSEINKYATEEDLVGVDLGEMNEKMFKSFYNQCKESYEEKIKQEEAEAKAKKEEQERLAKIEAENKKLQAELREKERLEAKAKKEKEEKERLEKERKENLAKAPLKVKLNSWLDEFSCPDNAEEHEVQSEIIEKFTSFKNWAKNKINNI